MKRDPYDVQPGDRVVVESPVFAWSGGLSDHDDYSGSDRPRVGEIYTVREIYDDGTISLGEYVVAPGAVIRLDALDDLAEERAPFLPPEAWARVQVLPEAEVEWASALSPQQSARAEALWQGRALLGEPEGDLYRYRQALLDLADFITYGKDPA